MKNNDILNRIERSNQTTAEQLGDIAKLLKTLHVGKDQAKTFEFLQMKVQNLLNALTVANAAFDLTDMATDEDHAELVNEQLSRVLSETLSNNDRLYYVFKYGIILKD